MGAGGNKEDAFIMLEELKKQVYEANMELPLSYTFLLISSSKFYMILQPIL